MMAPTSCIISVSYTHLDVYKRQVYTFDISLYSKKNNEKVQPKDGYSVKITLPVPKELLDDREKVKVVYGKDGSPVSYTHLDVYKRQYLYD